MSALSIKDNYFSVNALSKSGIDLILDCPAYYKAYQDGVMERKETQAMKFGTLVHTSTLEPHKLGQYAVTSLNLATTAGRAFKEENKDKIIVKDSDYDNAIFIADTIKSHPQAQLLFQNYQAERELYFNFQDVFCKAKPDIVANTPIGLVLADIKKTQSVDPKDIRSTIVKYKYYRQAWWYLNAMRVIGEPCQHFIFIFVEEKPPNLITMCYVSESFLTAGEKDCLKAIDILKECEQKNLYPCYTKDIIEIDMPHWMAKEYEQEYDHE